MSLKSLRRSAATLGLVAFLLPFSSLSALPRDGGPGAGRAQMRSAWTVLWQVFLESIYIDANGTH